MRVNPASYIVGDILVQQGESTTMELTIGGLCDVSDKTDWENTSAAGCTASRYPPAAG
jgi:hypothetical protein